MKMKLMTVVHGWKRQKSSPATCSKKALVSSPLRRNEGIKIELLVSLWNLRPYTMPFTSHTLHARSGSSAEIAY
ncbi:hypothetical protein WN943_012921 [Citrus x changshan-huyou]